MNFLTQLGVLAIILIILVILIKSNQTLEKIYMESESEEKKRPEVEIEIPHINLSEVKIPKWKLTKKKIEREPEEVQEEEQTVNRKVERSSGTMPVDTSEKWVVEVLDDRGRVVSDSKIYGFPYDIGRNEDNDLVLDDLSVSGYHARVEDAYGTLELVDQGSLNKIMIDGRCVTKVEITDRMEADFGNTRLRFRKEGKKSKPTIAYAGSSLMEEWH